jgi:antitoxin HigA-1
MPTKSNSSITTDRGTAKSIPRKDALTALRENPRSFSRAPEHPGVILREEFLEPLDLSAYRLAAATGMSQTRVGEILKGDRSVTADAAVRLGIALGTTAEFWLGLQSDYDLRAFLAGEGRQVIAGVTSLRDTPDDEPAPRRTSRG